MARIALSPWVLFFLFPLLPFAQSPDTTLTFIRLNSYTGYVIDSVENSRCRCVNYAGKNFSYGALVQLPDSNVVLRMKVTGRDNVVNVPMTKAEVDRLASLAALTAAPAVSGISSEEMYLMYLAGDTVTFRLMNFEELKFPAGRPNPVISTVADTTAAHIFFNIGIGISSRNSSRLYFAQGIKLGWAEKKHAYLLRVIRNKEPDPLFEDINPNEQIYDLGILYGKFFDGGRVAYTVSAGLGYMGGTLRGKLNNVTHDFLHTGSDYEEITLSTFGIPVEAEIMIGAVRNVNASVCTYGNLNMKHPYGGFLVSIRFGKVKNNKTKSR